MRRSASSPAPRTLFDAAKPAPPVVEGVAVRETPCRSLLNGSGSYTFNCYRGCTHACVYCYARFMERFHPHAEPWGGYVDVKINAPEVLAREVRRLPPGPVFTCSACDGWQSIERHYRLTRRCCELLVGAGFSLNILTKRDLVLRDLDILRGHEVSVGVTITTADESQAKLWEPGASSVAERVEVLRQAKAAGFKTHVMFGPLLPGISDTAAGMRELMEIARETGVDRIWTDVLNNRPMVWAAMRPFLERHHPHLLPLYRKVMFDAAYRADYAARVKAEMERAAEEMGVSTRSHSV